MLTCLSNSFCALVSTSGGGDGEGAPAIGPATATQSQRKLAQKYHKPHAVFKIEYLKLYLKLWMCYGKENNQLRPSLFTSRRFDGSS